MTDITPDLYADYARIAEDIAENADMGDQMRLRRYCRNTHNMEVLGSGISRTGFDYDGRVVFKVVTGYQEQAANEVTFFLDHQDDKRFAQIIYWTADFSVVVMEKIEHRLLSEQQWEDWRDNNWHASGIIPTQLSERRTAFVEELTQDYPAPYSDWCCLLSDLHWDNIRVRDSGEWVVIDYGSGPDASKSPHKHIL